MAIPDYQTIMLPLLKLSGDGKEYSLRDSIEKLANGFNLTSDDRKRLLPSGRQFMFDNRVAWAKKHLLEAGLNRVI